MIKFNDATGCESVGLMDRKLENNWHGIPAKRNWQRSSLPIFEV